METYHETVEWMFRQLPMYQRIGKQAFKKDLTNTLKLVEHLDNPHQKFKSVHVAGTNGKGSVSHMLASVLQEAGYKVGLYTSPHLRDFRERIKINGVVIPQEDVVHFIQQNKNSIENQNLSFFELSVGMAFEHFAKEKVDLGIIEVGMGGRLDSTNILMPEVSVITNIGLDHTEFLGNSLAEIAGEKAGIIKENVPVVVGEKKKETTEVFREVAKSKNAELIFAEEQQSKNYYATDLKGDYQKKNITSVLAVITVLRTKKGWTIPEESLINGLNKVKLNTGLQGRWDVLREKPKVVCDTGHNEEGLKAVFKQLKKEKFLHLHIVLGMVKDKDLNSLLPIFPKDAKFYFCKPDVPRGLEAENLQKKAAEFSLEGKVFSSVSKAYQAAIDEALDEDLIFIGGSNFTVAEVI